MKKILFPILSLAVLMAGCDIKSPLDQDLYPQKVYIKGVGDRNVNVGVDLAKAEDVVTVSVIVSGSRPTAKDVTATIVEVPEAVAAYNIREVSGTAVKFQAPPSYSFPSDKVTVPKGKLYQTYPINVETANMHCDSLYMIALQLFDPSVYEISRERGDSIAYVRFNLENEFSGQYSMDGAISIVGNDEEKPLSYQRPRMLTATDDGRTVRVYHFENEEVNEGDDNPNNDYRRLKTFKITVEEDNTLSFETWQDFPLLDAGGTYNEEWDLYDMWYTYQDGENVMRTEGFLYRDRTSAEAQRLLLNWIEEQRNERAPSAE